MDLIDRGFTIRDIGRKLSWFDVLTLFRHLPHDSETRKLMFPEQMLEGELQGTSNQLLGEVIDALKMVFGKLNGANIETLSGFPGTIDVILRNHRGEGPPKDQDQEAVEPAPKRRTPSEIRAELAKRQKKAE